VTGSGSQTRSICYVSDTVAGLLSLARSSESGPINLGNPVELTVTEIATLVAEIIGSQAGIRHLPAVVDDPQRRCPDINKAIQRLNWRPLVQLDEGLKQTTAAEIADKYDMELEQVSPALPPPGQG
jgi:dTDP-glucose 4,6-dehydratase